MHIRYWQHLFYCISGSVFDVCFRTEKGSILRSTERVESHVVFNPSVFGPFVLAIAEAFVKHLKHDVSSSPYTVMTIGFGPKYPNLTRSGVRKFFSCYSTHLTIYELPYKTLKQSQYLSYQKYHLVQFRKIRSGSTDYAG